jgi:hypothetical protein
LNYRRGFATLKAICLPIVISREFKQTASKVSIEDIAGKPTHSGRLPPESLEKSFDIQVEIISHRIPCME